MNATLWMIMESYSCVVSFLICWLLGYTLISDNHLYLINAITSIRIIYVVHAAHRTSITLHPDESSLLFMCKFVTFAIHIKLNRSVEIE